MTQPANPDPLPDEQLRASDADRQAVVDRLRMAYDEGRLTLAEYDERMQSAYAARTYADLDRLSLDLPAAFRLPDPEPAGPAASAVSAAGSTAGSGPDPAQRTRELGNLVWRITASSWFGVSMLNLLIWAAIGVSSGDWVYPWWIWVAGPWGLVILAGWLSGIGRQGRGGRTGGRTGGSL